MKILAIFDRVLGQILRGVSVAMMITLMLLLTGNIASRYLDSVNFGWFDEIVELCFAYLVFFGAAALWRERDHFCLEWLDEKLGKYPLAMKALKAGINIICLMFFVLFFTRSMELTIRAMDTTPVFRLSKRWLYGCMPVSGLIMLAYSVRNLVVDLVRGPGQGKCN